MIASADEAPPATSVVVLGAARVLAAAGGAATLGCAARLHPAPRALAAPPLHVRWLHDGEPVDLQVRDRRRRPRPNPTSASSYDSTPFLSGPFT